MRARFLVLILFLMMVGCASADEGMWTLDNLPLKQMQERYGFTPSQQWQDLAMHASLRFAQGCSASFVSADGLVMTNHHCAESCLSQLSTPAHDYSAKGFSASEMEKELKCPEVELNQLESITDVTSRMLAATDGKSGLELIKTQHAVASMIEKECLGADGASMRCDVVSFYGGARHALYKYRRFQDVRLVFAPETAIADFGGDPDNFNFPRYDLDVTFLRVYVNGKSIKSEYFQFDKSGPKADELVFVLGNPGSTERADTVAQLDSLRANFLTPYTSHSAELRGVLWQYGNESAEHARQSKDDRFFLENSLKIFQGQLEALNDAEMLRTKREEDDRLRAWVQSDPQRAAKYGDPWSALSGLTKVNAEIFPRYLMLVWAAGFNSDLFPWARALVRVPVERAKPDADRLPAYRDAQLPALEQMTFAAKPIYPEFDSTKLAWSLEKLRQVLGPDDPLIHQILGADSPQTAAAKLVNGSKLSDVAYRKRLWEGGTSAIASSDDPMIKLALLVDPESRRLTKEFEDRVEAVTSKNTELVARAKFERDGTQDYPDATFTLRLSYGVVLGWDEQGSAVKPFTDFAGLYARATNSDPFKLPETWQDGKSKLDPTTRYDLVSTNDIIGGNSGSPLIDREGHVVGLIFDGNIHSIGGNFFYDARSNRAVSVDTAAIEESVRKLYGNSALADELVNGHSQH